MELKRSVLHWLIAINLLILLSNSLNAQASFQDYRSFVSRVDTSVDIANYDKIYIVHFNMCTNPNYCGENLIKYINKNQDKSILILCDDLENEHLKKLENNKYTLLHIDFFELDRYGLLSVYNIEITKKRKVKKLI